MMKSSFTFALTTLRLIALLSLTLLASPTLLTGQIPSSADSKVLAISLTNQNTRAAYAFEMGVGVARDLLYAQRHYAAAVREGDAEGQYRLGYAYQMSSDIARQVKAAHLLARASAQGHVEGTYWLGLLYKRGRGVPKDWSIALPYFRSAAEQGHAKASSMVGYAYRWGKSVSIDYTEAIRWFQKSATQGEATAMSNLGDMYFHAQGVDSDVDEAAYWKYRAYRAGSVRDTRRLRELFDEGPCSFSRVQRRLISEAGESTLAVKLGATEKEISAILGKPFFTGRQSVREDNELIQTDNWTYACGSVAFRDGVVVDTTISLTTEVLENAPDAARDSPSDWRVRPSVAVGTAKYWALATSALLMEYNDSSHELLGTQMKSSENGREQAWHLFWWWGVANREDLLQKLARVQREGSRTEFDAIVRRLTVQHASTTNTISLLREIGVPEHRVRVAQREHANLGGKSLLGWDYSRYVALCRWGYLADYLAEEESWSLIMREVPLLQSIFDSWADLGRNYLIGRQFWSAEQTKEIGRDFEEVYQQLLNEPDSPWNSCPWDTDLAEGRDREIGGH